MTSAPDSNTPARAAGQATHNVNVASTTALTPPRALKAELPINNAAHAATVEGRQTVQNILRGTDDRFLVIAGPCSIHDVDAAREYARRLAELKQRFADRLYIVMRVYFEKPRTTVGWKGLINDPHLDGSFDIQQGVRLARKLLADITSLGLPAGTEMLDPITPQYLDDLVSWASIGARTTESQTHRQMASGLSMPVGFKNATDGNLQIAIDAMTSAQSPHHFLGIDDDGNTCIVETRGNSVGHVILRGGRGKPNYDAQNITEAARQLETAGLDPVLMVDCSHANSEKKHERQEVVWNSLIEQRTAGNRAIIGAMLESNLHEGKQSIPPDKSKLKHGVSVTDACIGWEKTEQLLREGYERLGAD